MLPRQHARYQRLSWDAGPRVCGYLVASQIYPVDYFRPQLRIPTTLSTKLRNDMLNNDTENWKTRRDGTAKRAILTKIVVLDCLRILGTARSFDDIDDSDQMGGQEMCMYFHCLYRDIVQIYSPTYFNMRPTSCQLPTTESHYLAAGFVRCAGSTDS